MSSQSQPVRTYQVNIQFFSDHGSTMHFYSESSIMRTGWHLTRYNQRMSMSLCKLHVRLLHMNFSLPFLITIPSSCRVVTKLWHSYTALPLVTVGGWLCHLFLKDDIEYHNRIAIQEHDLEHDLNALMISELNRITRQEYDLKEHDLNAFVITELNKYLY